MQVTTATTTTLDRSLRGYCLLVSGTHQLFGLVATQRRTASTVSTGLILKHILEDGGAFSWIALIIFSNKTVHCDNILTPAPIMMQSNFSCESVSETTLSAVSPRSSLHAFSVIPARYEHVPIWRTRGKYKKADETWLFQIAVQSTKQG